jgi:hypothetical protein
MKRIASKGIALGVLAILAMSGPAAAFTPVPIPTPRTGSAAVAQVAHDQAPAITRLEE